MSARWALALALAAGVAEAADPQPPHSAAAEVRCGDQTLPACTQQRLAALQRLDGGLRHAAAQQPQTAPGDPKAREELARFDRWLVTQSERVARLVAEGQRALAAAGKDAPAWQTSFNLQYLQLQNQLQDESRQFATVSNIMKTKHDTVKNSISNIR